MIDFVACGAAEVRGRLAFPRRYLVSRAYLDADRVINLASFRSHANIVLSGAIKNMFGTVVGTRKARIHHLFRGNPKGFSRAIADIYGCVKPTFSILDMTSVVEGQGIQERIQPVGLILGGTDGVALDALAAHITGYSRFPVWTTRFAESLGLGCADLENVDIRGVERSDLPSLDLAEPDLVINHPPDSWDRMTNLLNHTLLRPRPAIAPEACNACGECLERCPVDAISSPPNGKPYIHLGKCAECGCCARVCEDDAVKMRFHGIAGALRVLLGRPLITEGPAGRAGF